MGVSVTGNFTGGGIGLVAVLGWPALLLGAGDVADATDVPDLAVME
jgi:hypothetical protein